MESFGADIVWALSVDNENVAEFAPDVPKEIDLAAKALGDEVIVEVAATRGDHTRKEVRTYEVAMPLFDKSLEEGESLVLSGDVHMVGHVHVAAGAALFIQAGTRVFVEGENSALIVERGGRLEAIGTRAEPILFTPWAARDPIIAAELLRTSARGLWAGIGICGNAPCQNDSAENVLAGTSALYGGSDADDNSGFLAYLSVMHAGADISEGNGIDGITFAGVGRGTALDYIEVGCSGDAGIAFRGGTVPLRHAVVWHCRGDQLDVDEGYQGLMQFLFVEKGFYGDLHGKFYGNSANDATDTSVLVANATLVGYSPQREAGRVIHLKEDVSFTMANSLICTPADVPIDIADVGAGFNVSVGYEEDAVGPVNSREDQDVSRGIKLHGVYVASTPNDETITSDLTEVVQLSILESASSSLRQISASTAAAVRDVFPGLLTKSALTSQIANFPTSPHAELTGLAAADYVGAFDPVTGNPEADWMEGWSQWQSLHPNFSTEAA